MMRRLMIYTWMLMLGMVATWDIKGQANLVVRELFASVTNVSDSFGEHAKLRTSFLLNRPQLAARAEFRVGNAANAGDVFTGTVVFEKHGSKIYASFGGKLTEVIGDKVTLYWEGSSDKANRIRFVTVKIQAADGSYSNVLFNQVRFYNSDNSSK